MNERDAITHHVVVIFIRYEMSYLLCLSFPKQVTRLLSFTGKRDLKCKKPAYMLHHPSDHSIFATTHPGMYKYIPTDIEAIKTNASMNHDAGFQFIVATADAHEILKWYVLCALEKDCMAPHDAGLYCDFQNDRFNRYAGCHRYDQSAINLLLANSYEYNATNYVSNLGDGATIEGIALNGLTDANFSCTERTTSH
ncbi:unnamed protein product [Cylicocyclus nassatus]|uniref:Uncharacterized protein n=1 Tax=Cylicocyclus nassatus TaxID=53992 RepID=A0AA36GU10_CYLNA|nr:unnamed protein product [Cylicocyclus nassatus]